jgi:hypothetical protein
MIPIKNDSRTIIVYTRESSLRGSKFFTSAYIQGYRNSVTSLNAKYSKSVLEASETHIKMASILKEFFEIK